MEALRPPLEKGRSLCSLEQSGWGSVLSADTASPAADPHPDLPPFRGKEKNKNGRDRSRPFRIVMSPAQRGGGAAEAVPPLSSGVMRRTVTRRLMRLGPSVCSFRY